MHGDKHYNLAAEKALRIYGGEIRGWLYRRFQCHDTVNDMYSTFSLYFWTWFPSFKWESSLRTWMYSIARRVCYSSLTRHHEPLSQLPQNLSALIIKENKTITTYKHPDIDAAYQNLIDQFLNQEEKDLLVWRIDRQMSWNEIAQILSDEGFLDESELKKRATAIRVQFSRIKSKLREAAIEKGFLR